MKKTLFSRTELAKSYSEENKTAQEYFDQGNEKFNLQDYNGAVADYTKAIEIEPQSKMSYYYRGCAKIHL